jgi:hypothetical protein
MLANPVPGAPISLAVDASNFAIGAMLQQQVNNTWQPLGFLTKSLTPAQRKYSAYNRELLAMYIAIKRFRHAVKGRSIVIFTDHKFLTYAFDQNLDKYSPRQFRYFGYIGQFTTDIQNAQHQAFAHNRLSSCVRDGRATISSIESSNQMPRQEQLSRSPAN